VDGLRDPLWTVLKWVGVAAWVFVVAWTQTNFGLAPAAIVGVVLGALAGLILAVM